MIRFADGTTADLVPAPDGVGYVWESADPVNKQFLNLVYPMDERGWLPTGTRNGWLLYVAEQLRHAGAELTEEILPPIREKGVVY